MITVQADIFINLIATIGMLGLWMSVRQRGVISPVERRICYLAIAMAFLFFMRSMFWMGGSYTVERVALIPAIAIPFLVLMTTEGLMRRHAPFLIKLLAALSFVIAAFIIMIGHRQFEPWFSYCVGGIQLIIFLFCLAWIIIRKTSDLTASENRSANIFAVTLISVSLVSLTDFPEIIATPVRLGAVGMLVVAYLLVYANSRTFSMRQTVVEIITISAAVGIFLWMSVTVLGAETWQSVFQLGTVLLALLLTAVIIVRVFTTREGFKGQAELILAEANTDNLQSFLEESLAGKMTPYSAVLGAKDLSDYDIDSLQAAYETVPVISDKMLQGQLCQSLSKTACEQIDDVLTRHQATHSFMASVSPPIIVVSAAQPFGDEREFTAYLSLISKMAQLVKKVTPT